MKTRYIIKDLDGLPVFGYTTFSSFREAWDYIRTGYGYDKSKDKYYVVPEPQ